MLAMWGVGTALSWVPGAISLPARLVRVEAVLAVSQLRVLHRFAAAGGGYNLGESPTAFDGLV